MSPAFNQTPLNIVIAGASGAIGSALLQQLQSLPNAAHIYRLQRQSQQSLQQCATSNFATPASKPSMTMLHCDITQDEDLRRLTHRLQADGAAINVLINATGVLHNSTIKPEKALSQLTRENLRASFEINAFAPISLLHAVLPVMGKTTAAWVVNLSARVGSIEDNHLGGWYSYRAAKAAQNQLLKTASIELKRSHPLLTCLQLHPGTVDSALSKPFQNSVAQGKLFTPAQSAAHLLAVIASKTPAQTGTFWDWENTAIPW